MSISEQLVMKRRFYNNLSRMTNYNFSYNSYNITGVLRNSFPNTQIEFGYFTHRSILLKSPHFLLSSPDLMNLYGLKMTDTFWA